MANVLADVAGAVVGDGDGDDDDDDDDDLGRGLNLIHLTMVDGERLEHQKEAAQTTNSPLTDPLQARSKFLNKCEHPPSTESSFATFPC